MDHLVDTCALLLFLEDDPRLPAAATARIEDPAARSYVSLVSLWEIAIKVSLGKLRFDHASSPPTAFTSFRPAGTCCAKPRSCPHSTATRSTA